jgi:hypothetical protein
MRRKKFIAPIAIMARINPTNPKNQPNDYRLELILVRVVVVSVSTPPLGKRNLL